MGINTKIASRLAEKAPSEKRAYTKHTSVALRTKAVPLWVARAIERMVWEALDRPSAANAEGYSDEALRQHFKKPDVQNYYLRMCDQLRRGERHRNLHVAASIRDESESDKARLEAIKVLETDFDAKNRGHEGSAFNVNINIAPGYIADVSMHADKARAILAASLPSKPSKVIEHF